MRADFHIPRLSNVMKLAVLKNHLEGQILSKKVKLQGGSYKCTIRLRIPNNFLFVNLLATVVTLR